MTTKHTIIAALAGLLTFGFISEAAAQRRTNDLAKDVAVRHRRLLVKNRFELSPLFESTVNGDFHHIIGGGVKLEYHFTDMLSFGAVGVASVALRTKLVDRIVPALENDADPATREPSQAEFESRLNKMPLHGAVYASITPWYS